MGQWSYLNAYLSSIPASQRQALANKLMGQVVAGELSSTGEYETRLAQELDKLSGSIGNPSFKLRTAAEGSQTNSFNYNDMETRAVGDLQTLFSEAVLLEQAISDHKEITASKLDMVTVAIDRMEKQIDILEILAANVDGYVSSIFNSFSEDNTNRLQRYQTTSSTMFSVDGPGYLSPMYDAAVTGGSLKLPTSKEIAYKISDVSLANPTPDPSGSIDGFELARLIDADSTTYWAQIIDTQDSTVKWAAADLVVNLLGVQQLSQISLVPFSRLPYQITSIAYRKRKDIGDAIVIPGIDNLPIAVEGDRIIEFPTIYAEQIVISVKQTNRSQLRYILTGSDNTVSAIYDLTTGSAKEIPAELQGSNAINSVYYAMSSNMKSVLGITTTKTGDSTSIDVYEFMYGIKNLALQQKQYLPYGIFVSKDYTVSSLGAVGLEADQTIMPRSITNGPPTSIEYDLFIAATSGTNTQYTGSVPILPASVDVVEGEILDGTINNNSDWTCLTRFPADIGASGVVVYRNGTALAATDYGCDAQSDGRLLITIPGNTFGLPSIRTSSFSIDYTPTADAYIYELSALSEDENFVVDNAIINLRIFLRSIDPNRQLTPSVKSYSLKFKKYGK